MDKDKDDPTYSLLKNYNANNKKEPQKENLNLINQFKNKLNDFQNLFEDKKKEDLDSERSGKEKKFKAEKKTQLVNMLPQKSSNEKSLKDRIFWSKEKMHKVREKFLSAKLRIERKTEEDFNEIRKLIEDGDQAEVM
jgi:hypothetical protein